MEATFKYKFEADSLEDRLLLMNGYMQAIQQVFNYLKEETQFDPNKRYIDSVPLVEKIMSTCGSIEKLQADYQTELSLLNLFK